MQTDKIQKIIIQYFSVILLCIFLFGISVGCFASYHIYKWRMNEIVKVGGFLFEEQIYDVKKRVIP